MEDYKSNSHKTKRNTDSEKKKVEKVIKGDVITKKKPAGQKLAETFISEDVDNIGSYLLFDVLIPAMKDTTYDMLTSGLGMLLGRESIGSLRRPPSVDGRTSYEKYSGKNNTGNSTKYYTDSRTRSRYNPDDIIFGMRVEAEQVLDVLLDIVDEFGMVSISDLKEAVGLDTIPSDNKYGWYDLGMASVVRTHDGYLIKLPRTILLD